MTRTETVVSEIRRRIEAGAVKAGARLPSIRRAAAEFDVSKNKKV